MESKIPPFHPPFIFHVVVVLTHENKVTGCLLAFSLCSLQICYASSVVRERPRTMPPETGALSHLTRKFCKLSAEMPEDSLSVAGRKEVIELMAIYTIIRVYEVPADTKQQATERMLEALMFHVESDFHVKDIIREPGTKPGQGRQVDLRPAGWLTLLREQLGLAGKR
jgi:hypothetical protein